MVPALFTRLRHLVKTMPVSAVNTTCLFVQLVDAKGNMSEDAPFAGTFVKKGRPADS